MSRARLPKKRSRVFKHDARVVAERMRQRGLGGVKLPAEAPYRVRDLVRMRPDTLWARLAAHEAFLNFWSALS